MNKTKSISELLFNKYNKFKESQITHRRFKHSDMLNVLEKFRTNKIFSFEKIGESVLGKELNLIKIGKGKTKIFLWSQMHGNESTATMAIFDIFNFFADTKYFNDIKENIFNNLTLYFLPMVNPDGTELFKRRNFNNIDINRDAVAQQTPEGKILMDTFKKIKPKFAFNLHDQSILYSAGNSKNPAAISFLAPAYNEQKSLNETRKNSMRVIGAMYKIISNFIPNKIARYSDEFEPRAFGDNFQKLGANTILVESGGYKNDKEKQIIRKMNFLIILLSLYMISDKKYKKVNLNLYSKIPFNEQKLFNKVLKNLTINENGRKTKVDIGINMEEINCDNSNSFYLKSDIAGIGDLSTFYGYDEYNFKGYNITPGKIYKRILKNSDKINLSYIKKLLKQGYTNIVVEQINNHIPSLPINIFSLRNKDKINSINTEIPADFVISKNDTIYFIVLNGFVIDLKKDSFKNINGLIYY